MSGRVGHVGVDRSRGFPREFIAAGNWRRKRAGAGRVLPAGLGAPRADLGRLAFAGHAASRAAREKPDGCASTCSIAGAVWEVPPRSGRSTMPRVLCVWFPKWPIQRLRSERPELRAVGTRPVRRPESAALRSRPVRPKAERHRHPRRPTAGRGQGAHAEGRLPPRRRRRGSPGPASTGARWPAVLAPGRPGRGHRVPSRCSATSPAARTSGKARSDSSRPFATTGPGDGYLIRLALAGSVGAAWAWPMPWIAWWSPPGRRRWRPYRAFPWSCCGCRTTMLVAAGGPGPADDPRCPATPARDAGQPVRRRSCRRGWTRPWACVRNRSSSSGCASR